MRPPIEAPGRRWCYSNTNFTLLQTVIETVTGSAYPDVVRDMVLRPMGINTDRFSHLAEPRVDATLTYRHAADKAAGLYWPTTSFVGTAGWVATANELLRFLIGLRRNLVLSESTTRLMLAGSMGWYRGRVAAEAYYFHDGELCSDRNQAVCSAVCRFTSGYDAVLLANSPVEARKVLAQVVDRMTR